MKKVITVLICALFAITLYAQPGPPMGPGHGEGPWEGGKKDELRERLEMMKMWKMVEMLELNEEQSTQFFPIYNEHQNRLEELKEAQLMLMEDLEIEVKAEKIDESAVTGLIDSLITVRSLQCQSELEFYNRASEILTTRQQAMLALFEKRFREEVKKIIEAGRSHVFPGPR